MTEGTRLSPDWQPAAFQPDSVAWQVANRWTPYRLSRELEKFRAYWTSQTGRKALKRDWQATWTTWILRADRFDDVRRMKRRF